MGSKNSYIIMSNVTLNKLISSFEMLGSVTDQTEDGYYLK